MAISIEDVEVGDIVGLEGDEEGEVIDIDYDSDMILVEVVVNDLPSTIELDPSEPWLRIISSGDPPTESTE